MPKNQHYTASSTEDYVNRLSFDFITQLAKRMDALGLNQTTLGRKLKLTSGRVSQIFNNPGNLTLNKMTEYARAVGMKISVVAYDDGDPNNERGPVTSEIFALCWEKYGKPHDFEPFNSQILAASTTEGVLEEKHGFYFFLGAGASISPQTSSGNVIRGLNRQITAPEVAP